MARKAVLNGNQYVVYVGNKYRIAEVLRCEGLNDHCLKAFMRHQGMLRMHGVFLRDGATGKRYTFAEAMANWCTHWKSMDVRQRPNGTWGVYVLTDAGWCWGASPERGELEYPSEIDAIEAMKAYRTKTNC